MDEDSDENVLLNGQVVDEASTDSENDSTPIDNHYDGHAEENERKLARFNCPERIIFVVDNGVEEDVEPFKRADRNFRPLALIKKAITIFIGNKSSVNPQHSYALVVLQEDEPEWVCDFSKNSRNLLRKVNDLQECDCSKNTYDLTRLFDLIREHVQLPLLDESSSVNPPPYIVRTIFLYGRSHSIPQFLENKRSFNALCDQPSFFLDTLYLHEHVTDENKCEGIFEVIEVELHNRQTEDNNTAYSFEVGRSYVEFLNTFARFLAHPLQRPPQKHALNTSE